MTVAAGDGERAAYPLDVLVLGGVGVDTIVRVEQLPVPLADTVHVPPMRRYVGHSGSGWALGLHALGVRTHLLDLVGEDLEGGILRDRFAAVGLPFTGVVVQEGTKLSVNLVTPDGARTSFHDGRGQRLHPQDAGCHRALLGQSRHVHVTINDWTRAAMREALADGRTVSTDLNDWDGANPHHEEFAYAADLVFVSAAALGDRGLAVADEILRRGRASLVVVTAGAEGSMIVRRDLAPVGVAAAAVPGRPVIDTNGAGDAFGAGFLAAWLRGLPAELAARWGSLAGAWACGSAGTHADPIDLSTLRSLL